MWHNVSTTFIYITNVDIDDIYYYYFVNAWSFRRRGINYKLESTFGFGSANIYFNPAVLLGRMRNKICRHYLAYVTYRGNRDRRNNTIKVDAISLNPYRAIQREQFANRFNVMYRKRAVQSAL